ncbi:MAG: hypothetical protein LIO90_09830 [Bacteroidales bacterium]|nr:hypothetical protein [Bacteroidales bacterium]
MSRGCLSRPSRAAPMEGPAASRPSVGDAASRHRRLGSLPDRPGDANPSRHRRLGSLPDRPGDANPSGVVSNSRAPPAPTIVAACG